MKHIVWMITLLSICASAQTLDDYAREALENNAGVMAKYLAYQAALEKIPQVGALPDPQVSFGYFISPVETRVGAQQARFSVIQMFPWLGTLDARKKVAAEMARAKYEEFMLARNEVIANVKETYFKLHALRESVRLTNENLDILETYRSLAVQKFQSALTGMVDVLRLDLEIAELTNQLQLLTDKEQPLVTLFNQHLNRDTYSPVIITDGLEETAPPWNKDALTDSVLTANNQLLALRHMSKAADLGVSVARKEGAPSVGIDLSYIIVAERTDMSVPENGKDAFMPMLTVRLPLYRSRYRSMRQEAELNRDAYMSMESQHSNMLRTQVDMLWVDYEDAVRRVALYRNQQQTAEQVLRILVEAYSATGKDFEEVLRMQRALLMYEMEEINAVRDALIAVAKLEALF